MTELQWMKIFAGNLLDIMQEAGVNQMALARDSGVSQATISKCLRGEHMPSVKTIVNLTYALDCDIRDLIDFGDYID